MAHMMFNDLICASYQDGGRGPNYDCFGLWIEVNRRLGRTVPDYGIIISKIAAVLQQEMVKKTKPMFHLVSIPTPGDLVLIRSASLGYICHIGVMIDNENFLQALKKECGIVKTPLSHFFWKDRIEGIYHYVG